MMKQAQTMLWFSMRYHRYKALTYSTSKKSMKADKRNASYEYNQSESTRGA